MLHGFDVDDDNKQAIAMCCACCSRSLFKNSIVLSRYQRYEVAVRLFTRRHISKVYSSLLRCEHLRFQHEQETGARMG